MINSFITEKMCTFNRVDLPNHSKNWKFCKSHLRSTERNTHLTTSYYTIKIFQCSLDLLTPHVQYSGDLEVDLIYKPLRHDLTTNDNLFAFHPHTARQSQQKREEALMEEAQNLLYCTIFNKWSCQRSGLQLALFVIEEIIMTITPLICL